MIARYFLCACVCAFATRVAASDDPLESLTKGQPKDVIELVDRIVGCNHWSGEEPYDAERRKEIAVALADLRCERLAIDKAVALRRYAKKPLTLKVLQQADGITY